MSLEIKVLYLAACGFDYDYAPDHRNGLDIEDGDYPDDEFLILFDIALGIGATLYEVQMLHKDTFEKWYGR